jgi:hypothetical protein
MRFISLLFFYLFLSACSSMANIDYDKDINFKSFATYSIQNEPVKVTDDTRINSSFMLSRIVSAIDTSLEKKGLSARAEKASLKVKYYLDVKRDIETESSGVSVGFGTFSRHSSINFGFMIPVGETQSIDRLVLTIDMLSTKTGELIWRGSLTRSLYEGATPESYNQLVNELVTDLLENFPPK